MHGAVLLPTVSAATTSVSRVEVGLVAVALVLLVALVLVRVKRDHDQKIRKAAAIGYYDPDAARYGHGSVSPLVDVPADSGPRPLAPSFMAPGRAAATGRGTRAAPSPRPVPTALFTPSTDPSRPLPAFDPVEAISARPTSTGGPPSTAVTQPQPPPETQSPPAAPPLPRLDQPPPP